MQHAKFLNPAFVASIIQGIDEGVHKSISEHHKLALPQAVRAELTCLVLVQLMLLSLLGKDCLPVDIKTGVGVIKAPQSCAQAFVFGLITKVP